MFLVSLSCFESQTYLALVAVPTCINMRTALMSSLCQCRQCRRHGFELELELELETVMVSFPNCWQEQEYVTCTLQLPTPPTPPTPPRPSPTRQRPTLFQTSYWWYPFWVLRMPESLPYSIVSSIRQPIVPINLVLRRDERNILE